jgi:hypothetical protein
MQDFMPHSSHTTFWCPISSYFRIGPYHFHFHHPFSQVTYRTLSLSLSLSFLPGHISNLITFTFIILSPRSHIEPYHFHFHYPFSQVTYASLARKHGLSASSQEWLARVHTIPSVPLADCHKRLKEQIKVHLLLPTSQQDLLAALDVIEG